MYLYLFEVRLLTKVAIEPKFDRDKVYCLQKVESIHTDDIAIAIILLLKKNYYYHHPYFFYYILLLSIGKNCSSGSACT